MRSYNAFFVYSRLWLLARETNAFSGELAGFYAAKISHFPPDWAPQEDVGCTAEQQQATQPHLKLGGCHQWCSSSLGCTGNAGELPVGGDQAAALLLPQRVLTLPPAQPLTRNATWAALEQKGYGSQYWLLIYTNFSAGLEHFVMADVRDWNLTQQKFGSQVLSLVKPQPPLWSQKWPKLFKDIQPDFDAWLRKSLTLKRVLFKTTDTVICS